MQTLPWAVGVKGKCNYLQSVDGILFHGSDFKQLCVLHVLSNSLKKREWLVEHDGHCDLAQILAQGQYWAQIYLRVSRSWQRSSLCFFVLFFFFLMQKIKTII